MTVAALGKKNDINKNISSNTLLSIAESPESQFQAHTVSFYCVKRTLLERTNYATIAEDKCCSQTRK